MNLRDIKDKLRDTVLPQKDREEEVDLMEKDKNESEEVEKMENEQKPISDEVEQFEEQPLRIKTILVKSEDEEDNDAEKKKLSGAVKVAAGVAIAAAGITALILGSRKKKW